MCVFVCKISSKKKVWNYSLMTSFILLLWTDDLLIDIRGAIYLMELWVLSSSSCEQTSSSKIDTFSGRPLPLRRFVNPVSLNFLIKLWTAMRGHSKLGCSFQILYAFQPFLLKSFSVTAFCLSVKIILLRSSELGNWETSEQRLVTSTDFDLHCNGFLHRHDFFTRQRRKKTN